MITSILNLAFKLPIKHKITKLNLSLNALGVRFKSDDSDIQKNLQGSTPDYEAYPDYKTQSPYREKSTIRRRYYNKIVTKGVLPRPEGKWEDVPLPQPVFDPLKRNKWTSEKALFGQNDYIDILGDGTIHPWELVQGPAWVRGVKGGEMERLLWRLEQERTYLQEFYPSKLHQIEKQVRFLHRRMNKRVRSAKWGGYRSQSRIDKPIP